MENFLNRVAVTAPDLWQELLIPTFNRFDINTDLRQQHFLAQCLHESQMLTRLSENLNYSAERLLEVFPKYFTRQNVLAYKNNPQNIANRIYADRMGNGSEQSGDGYKYRGRGIIQLTGRDNYRAAMMALEIDLINQPDLLIASKRNACDAAGWFWQSHGLNALADKDDILTITKHINGGVIGLSHRSELLDQLKGLRP